MPHKGKKKSELKVAREGKVGKISILGPIGWDFFGVSHRGFRDMLKELGKVNMIEVDITSPGGFVTDGLAIANDLIQADAIVHVYVNGQAASMASVITMAADRIFIPSNSTVMIHKPLVFTGGNADEHRKSAEILDTLEEGLINTYMRHFKGTREELEGILREETYFTAEQMDEKFNNVTVMSQELEAVAYDPISEELGDTEYLDQENDSDEVLVTKEERNLLQKILARCKKANPKPKEVDMPLTKEEKEGLVKDTTASVVAALKEAGVIKAKEDPTHEEVVLATAKADAASEAAKIEEVPFEGDKNKAEDVLKHIAKLKSAQLFAATDFNDPVSVAAYHKESFEGENAEVLPDSPLGASTVVTGKNQGITSEDRTEEAINAEKAKMDSARGIKKV
jgi:ATP-dependent protease ClpP protease subunit